MSETHTEIPTEIVGDYPYCQCSCNRVFKNKEELQNHLWANGNTHEGSQPYSPPINPIFNPLPNDYPGDYPSNIPIVFGPANPTILELVKALRECFAATDGRVPTAPLDELIGKYDPLFTIGVVDGKVVKTAVKDIMKAKGFELNKIAKFPPEPPKGGFSEVEHTWLNLYSDDPTFNCKCGEEFETHKALMDHTAKSNPTMRPEDFGRAGAGIERSAHEGTLKLLRRARDLLLKSHDHSLLETQRLLADIREQCPVLNEPDEETGYGD